MQSHMVQRDFEIAGGCIPVETTGGDFFDVRATGNRVGFMVGDVMGKGSRAAARVGVAQDAWTQSFDAGSIPSTVLLGVNQTLCDAFGGHPGFVTMLSGQVDLATGIILLASAGHPPPVVVRSSGCVESVRTRGVMAGILRQARYTDEVICLGPGDLLFLYTDGVPDGLGRYRGTESKWVKSLLQYPTGAVISELVGNVLGRLREVDSSTARRDDMATLVVRRRA